MMWRRFKAWALEPVDPLYFGYVALLAFPAALLVLAVGFLIMRIAT